MTRSALLHTVSCPMFGAHMPQSRSSRIATAALVAAILGAAPHAAVAAPTLTLNDPASFLTINGDLNLDASARAATVPSSFPPGTSPLPGIPPS